MAADECSSRALRLTEHVISMNPAHYTVWLYRFKIISHSDASIPNEIEWLNSVSLANPKNYQIWHHRQLLLNHYCPQIEADASALATFAESEIQFVHGMLEDDTKNYHVWSFRKYVVEKLGLFNANELSAVENMIEDDVRNNSAWTHRFFLVFSDPSSCTPGTSPTIADPAIPAATIDREVEFTKGKILLAPQNQAGWNYLHGVLVKGGRAVESVEGFVNDFIQELGQSDEVVTSSHALDWAANIHKNKGNPEKAKLCLSRLCEKWDPIREGYWKYRATQI